MRHLMIITFCLLCPQLASAQMSSRTPMVHTNLTVKLTQENCSTIANRASMAKTIARDNRQLINTADFIRQTPNITAYKKKRSR